MKHLSGKELVKYILWRCKRIIHPKVKVFGIGLPKTGTTTLGTALATLGYRHLSYDMNLARNVKAGLFDPVIGKARMYDSFDDWPWFMIYEELYTAFPDAKFVLTLRSTPEIYTDSLRRHHMVQGLGREDFAKPDWWDEVFGYEPKDWDYVKSKNNYIKHEIAVDEFFKCKGNCIKLCWEDGDEWESLCRFLGEPIPLVSFPHSNPGFKE